MKHRLFCLLIILLLVAQQPAKAVTPELFRLQIVANSDSAEDQAVKLAVRDAVLELAQQLLAEADSAQAAAQIARKQIAVFRRVAAEIAGYPPGEVRAEVGVFDFPDRVYGGVLVPAGEYRALRITLGEGEGHNWWCVLYPTLCSVDETAVGEDGRITFYSHTLRFLERLFGGDVR